MCAGNTAISLLLVGVGVFASHVLKRPAATVNKQRERKLWVLIWILLVASLLELTYSIYEQAARPNPKCTGLFPVTPTQERNKVGNSLTWLVHKLISTTLGDVSVLIAFWPTKKVHSPLLKDSDMDYMDTEEAMRAGVSRTYISEDGVSMVEEDRSPDRSPVRA